MSDEIDIISEYVVKGKFNKGYCPVCERDTVFIECGEWKRDHYRCYFCSSLPRNRALIMALISFFPNWYNLTVHESSPHGPTFNYLKSKCLQYSVSYCFQGVKPGDYKDEYRCENLEKMTFPSKSFDIFITQDVFEHVMNPDKAFAEIARVLKPGGAHVFTMPWYKQQKGSVQRAKMRGAEIVNLETPMYHGNPVEDTGSLVTYDWGIDFADRVYKASKMHTIVYLHKDRNLGLDAEFLEVFISYKSDKK